MIVNFITPTRLSILDISSMGDSVKRGDEKTVGMYDSGLKYAIAILLRNNVGIDIRVKGEPVIHETYEEQVTEQYSFSTYIDGCQNTGKKKELIQVNCETIPHGGEPMNPHDMREPSQGESWIVKTGFAKAMGHNWSDFMAIRELWSNMLDEGGHISNVPIDDNEVEGTVITLHFDENNVYHEIWKNKHLYINEEEPLFIISNEVEVLKNEENYLRIYKQNILVHEDKNKPSRFAWNIKFGELDETRILRNVSDISSRIAQAICYTSNEEFLRQIITADFQVQEDEFLEESYTYCSASDLMNKIATEVSNEQEIVKSYDWIISKIKLRKDCGISGKIIKTIEDSLWGYSKDVTVETIPCPINEELEIVEDEVVNAINPLQRDINKFYNFTLDVEVKRAKLKGNKVIADKHDGCLIISEDFDVEKDFPCFIVEYLDLSKKNKNVVVSLSEYIVELIKK